MSQPSEDDPVRRRSEPMARFFQGVMRRQVAGHFRALRLARPGLPDLRADRPVMVFTNHPSWWDPAVFIAVHGLFFPGRLAFGPIDAAMLEKYRFMGRIGLFGVDQESARGAAAFLRRGSAILGAPDRVMWITAQGRFADPRTRPLGLRPGAAHLMARVPGLVALPLALEYPFWTEKRPEALLAFGDPVEAEPGEDASLLAPKLETALTRTADDLAARAMARDPAGFETLIGGTRGTGGIYGLWQRARAATTGRPFEQDHAPGSDR
ncbi:lysophospholipid acyltransferase family protein [Roseicyclus sp. F158]|uniref:Lysophospholipid acyltransferase family protein n=1 Tax=Tropicimonas omnivorans TaxID=3075590 RepID=A0ABU3DL39_9RHOB|nr:lysophospholipid acyltransferase family protein [Roseicyclus sp. F158]MDT0684435.1 lysophospholipid acyltransferase family protein [Roseicyclus sp. F158]